MSPETPQTILLVQWESNPSGSPESGRIFVESLLKSGWKVVVAVGHSGPYVEIYRKIGCEVVVVPQKHWLQQTGWRRRLKMVPQSIRATFTFWRLIRRLRPTVVYINTIVGPEAAVAAKVFRIPVIWHIRDIVSDADDGMHGLPLLGVWGVRKIIHLLSDHIVVVSKAVSENVVDPVSANKLSVVLNGVSQEFCSHNSTATQSSQTTLIIGVPGTLRRTKGQDFLLKAVSLAANRLGDFQVLITGEGDNRYRDELIQLARALKIEEHVHFVGHVSRMPEFLQRCHIVVVPSASDPLPRTVMEAMASGAALIATAVGGIPEMVDHGRNGMLVQFDDVQELASTICTLSGDAATRERLGKAAAAKAKCEFSVASYQQRLLAIVDRFRTTNGESTKRQAG